MTIIGCKITTSEPYSIYAGMLQYSRQIFYLQNLEKIHMLLPYCLDYNCCGDLHLVYAWCHMLVMVNVALYSCGVGESSVSIVPLLRSENGGWLFLTPPISTYHQVICQR